MFLVGNPIFAVALFLSAFATSAILSKVIPYIKNEVDMESLPRYPEINGLRGFLAVSVFVCHCSVTLFTVRTGRWESPPSIFYTQLGQTSVVLFFMITAFLFWGRLIDHTSKIDWKALYISRLFRIYPLYILFLALVLAIVFWDARDVLDSSSVRYVGEVLNWLLFDQPSVNEVANSRMFTGVIWTLRYELAFYLSLPLLGFLFFHTGRPLLAMLSLCLLILYVQQLSGTFKLSIAVSFLGGVAAAHWVRSDKLRFLAKGKLAGYLAVLSLIIVMVFVKNAYKIYPVFLLSIFFIVVSSGNALFLALKSKPAIWLGEISFSIYLLHGVLLWIFTHKIFVFFSSNSTQMLALSMLGLSVLLVVAASITFLILEKNGIRLGRAVAHRFVKQ